jgi:PAS domain S-box-containing protein
MKWWAKKLAYMARLSSASVHSGGCPVNSKWKSRQARHLAEDYARDQERYRLLFERNLAGVFRSTVEGTLLDCNDAFARMIGYESPDELRKRQMADLYPSRMQREELTAQLRRDGSVTNREVVLIRRDGTAAVLLENITLVPHAGDQPAILEGTAVDITRQRQLEERHAGAPDAAASARHDDGAH